MQEEAFAAAASNFKRQKPLHLPQKSGLLSTT
jgi:hypothetical protein